MIFVTRISTYIYIIYIYIYTDTEISYFIYDYIKSSCSYFERGKLINQNESNNGDRGLGGSMVAR